jgi:hypothetical protein
MRTNAQVSIGILLILLLTTSVVIGQDHPASKLPRFEDYAVPEKWGGIAAPVQFQTPSDREFRTQFIRASKEPPNFAGHYRVATWGCGTDCLEGGIVDLSTGQLLPLPHSRNYWPGKWGLCAFVTGGEFDRAVQTRPTSRLLIANCSDAYSQGRNAGTYLRTSYFVFENGKFRKIAEHVGKERVF